MFTLIFKMKCKAKCRTKNVLQIFFYIINYKIYIIFFAQVKLWNFTLIEYIIFIGFNSFDGITIFITKFPSPLIQLLH